jgi:membrane protease YdiL (CAAX protease family)
VHSSPVRGQGSGPDASSEPVRADARAVARRAVWVTFAIYAGYAALGWVGVVGDLRYLALIAAFYFAPQWALRGDEARQRRYQVGPSSVIPRLSWRGVKVAAWTMALVFPPFVLGFFWFYARVCPGELDVLQPVLWVEGLTPAAGGLERYLERLCAPHAGTFWPASLRLPEEWLAYGGLGVALAVAIEVFHRGYLMSALEERFEPRRRLLGVPFGLAALLSSLMFAVGHLVGLAEVARLATFFPAMLFAWLWRRSGSLWAPALFHAASNLLMAILIASTFPK